MTRFEIEILSNLILDDDYTRKVLPYIQEDYFTNKIDRLIFSEIKLLTEKYNKVPNRKVLLYQFQDKKGLNGDEFSSAIDTINSLTEKSEDLDWLIDKTEKFCKDRALYNAIMNSIQIMDGNSKNLSVDAIPSLLQDALAVSFESTIGHDYISDANDRYDFYHMKEDRIPFDIKILNKITKGGLPRKTLNCIIGATNFGKSLVMCHHAASSIKLGYNALYITAEMAEERIAERIDCNILDIDIDDLHKISKDDYTSRMEIVQGKSFGKLIIKEYPTSTASVTHFRSLLEELKIKKNFVPDVIYVDYLNICASSRYKAGAVNTYVQVKSIAEELRGLAVEYNVAMITATQVNRSGVKSSDIGIDDTSDSFGIPFTMDFMLAGIRTEELDDMGQVMFKQLKSRYGDVNYFRKFVVGLDIKRFKLYDVKDPTEGLMIESNKNIQQKFGKPEEKEFDFDF